MAEVKKVVTEGKATGKNAKLVEALKAIYMGNAQRRLCLSITGKSRDDAHYRVRCRVD